MRAAGIRFGCVLADAGYGLTASFRQALRQAGSVLGRRHSASPESLPARCPTDLPRECAQSATHPSCARSALGQGRGGAGDRHMATDELATWYQDRPGRQVRRNADPHCGRTAPAYRQAWGTAHAGRGSVAGRRAAKHRRTEILSVQSTGRYAAQGPRPGDQGTMGLRAGPSATQGGTRPRSLRGAIVDRAASACSARHDGLCPPPILSPQGSRAEKKPSRVRRLSPVCQRSVSPFLIASSDHHAGSALTAAGRSVHPHHRKCQSSARLRTHNQKMTVAARQMAEKKTFGHLS